MRFAFIFLAAWSVLSAAPTLPIVASGGSAFSVDFDGFHGSAQTPIDGLSATLNFSGFAFTSQAWASRTRVDFAVEVVNTSAAPITASRVSSLGFDTSPNILRTAPHAVSGAFDSVTINGNMPSGIGRVEFCFSDVNCSGGGNGGPTIGQNAVAYATIYLSGASHTSLTFDEMFVRYQSISGAGGVTSGAGAPVGSPVPETGSYVVLSLGLVAVFTRLRRTASTKTAG